MPATAFADEEIPEDSEGTIVELTDTVEELSDGVAEEAPMYAMGTAESAEEGYAVEELAVSSPNNRSQADIARFAQSHPFSLSANASYSSTPVTSYPYSAGSLSTKTQNEALNALNLMRYIAGIDANIGLDSGYTQKAQAASLVNAANGVMSHTPRQPSGMSASLYSLGATGASQSNLAKGFVNPAVSLVEGYMDDSSSKNVKVLGHRRWCLNTVMSETGFGQAGNHSAMYAFDGGGWGVPRYTNVAWPARNMPIEYWYSNEPWSLGVQRATITNTGAVSVKVTRVKDNRTWNFSSRSSDGDFYVNNEGYGDLGAIIFRPAGLTVGAGDEFKVSVSGTTAPTSYTVKFFDMSKTDTSGSPSTPTPTPDNPSNTPQPPSKDVEGVASKFTDVVRDMKANGGSVWYVSEGWLNYVVNNGYMSGYSNGNFGPYDAITRAQVATILYRCSNPGSSATSNPASYSSYGSFRDDPGGQYYTAALNWCKAKKIITGYEDSPGSGVYTTFKPDKPVTREELAAMVARYAQYNGVNINNANATKFYNLNGSGNVSSWAKTEFIWCVDKGIITGIKSGGSSYLQPQDSAWRAAMAKVITVTMRDVLNRL